MFEYYNDGNISFKIEQTEGEWFAHVAIKKWSKQTMIKSAKVWETFLVYAKEQGRREIYSLIPDDKLVLKFNNMFGFQEVASNKGVLLLKFDLENA